MESLVGGRLGRFQIRRLIGKGGMGEVYAALDENLDREVAVKVLSSQVDGEPHRRRFLREAKLAARLNHPNIASIHEIGESDGRLYIVLELLEGETLRNILNLRRLSIEEVLTIARDVARALARAHVGEVIHRDIKPENIFIIRPTADTIAAKVLDFGLARDELARRKTDEESTATDLTGPGEACGTAGYLAPEQARGIAVDIRADIFSFGAVLYEMLTGKRAFDGKNQLQRMLAVVKTTPEPVHFEVPDVSSELEAILEKCLSKTASERYDDGTALLAALEAHIRGSQKLPGDLSSQSSIKIVSDLDPRPAPPPAAAEEASSSAPEGITATPPPVRRPRRWNGPPPPWPLLALAGGCLAIGLFLIVLTVATRPTRPGGPTPHTPVIAAARGPIESAPAESTPAGEPSPPADPAASPPAAPAPPPPDRVEPATMKPHHPAPARSAPAAWTKLPAPSATPASTPPPPVAAPPPATETPKTGVVRLPPGQDVMTIVVDGEHRRVKDGSIVVSCGRHRIRVGFKDERVIEVPCGGTFTL